MEKSVNEILKRCQDNFVSNIEAIKKFKIADSYYRVAESELSSLADKGVEAALLLNFQQILDSEAGQMITRSANYGPYVMEIWPLVTAWYPEFPLKDLISVQPMDKPLAYLFFSKLQTGTNKGNIKVGEVVETATGPRTIRGKYPTGEVFGETILPADLDFNTDTKLTTALLAYAPLNVAAIPGYVEKIRLTIKTASGTKTYSALNIVNGVVHMQDVASPGTDSGITIDIQTGLISYPSTTATTATEVQEITANYVWNIDYATVENIQKIVEFIEQRPLEAVPRALALEWTLFSEYLKKSQFGVDIRTDNTKRMLDLLYQYQVRYILDELYDYAAGNNGQVYEVTIPNDKTMSVEVKSQQVTQELKQCANLIEIASGRIEGNRIVCGKNFKSFLESLPNTLFQSKAQPAGFSTPREIGTYGTFKVYYDNTRGDDEAFMTYRGSEFYDAAYYLGEYMPCVPTDAIALGVTVRSSFVSMEAYKYDKPTCVVKMSFKYE